jgi:ATP phosphoribosyltransferase
MLIEFTDELQNLTTEEKLKLLLAYHNLPLDYKVDKEDMPVVVLALNQDDIATIKINDEGAIDIAYYGEDWQKPETNMEEYVETTIRLN